MRRMTGSIYRLSLGLLVVFAALTAACAPSGSDTGIAAINLRFKAPPRSPFLGLLTGVCVDVRVRVYSDGSQIAEATCGYESYECRVDNIPAGSDRRFTAQCLDATSGVAYEGAKDSVNVQKGKTVLVEIVMAAVYATDKYPPARVGDLTATLTLNETSILLRWTAVGDDGLVGTASQYDLRQSLGTIQEPTWDDAIPVAGLLPPAASGTDEQFTLDGLCPETTYHFALKVMDDGKPPDSGNPPNSSPISNEAYLDTGGETQPPSTIADLAAPPGEVTQTSVKLTWTAPADQPGGGRVDHYLVRYSESPINENDFDNATDAPAPSPPADPGLPDGVVVEGLTNQRLYYFRVKSCDAWACSNCSAMSNPQISARAEDVTRPGQVTSLAEESTTDTSATLTWLAPGDDGHDLDTAATSYDLRYVRDDVITEDNFSSPVSFPCNPTPGNPQTAGSIESHRCDGLDTGVPYYFALKTYDEEGNESLMSNVIRVVPGVEDVWPPCDVIDLTAAVVDEYTVGLSWTAPAEDCIYNTGTVHHYIIKYNTVPIDGNNFDGSSDCPQVAAPVTVGQIQNHDCPGLNPEVAYHFRFKACDDRDQCSDLSNAVTETPVDTIPPSDVADLQVIAFDDQTATLRWTAPGDNLNQGTVTGYEIRYRESSIATEIDWNAAAPFIPAITPKIAGSSEVAVVPGLTQGRHYYFRLKAVDEKNNWSGMSNQADQVLLCPDCPVIASYRPGAAPRGALVYLDGSNFEALPGTVTFGGQAAAVRSWSDTRIFLVVPAVSGTVEVVVTNSIGPGKSFFDVTPYIESLSPTTIPNGGTVILSGSGFGNSQGSSTISFSGSGSQPAASSWSDSQIVVSAPFGAATGPMWVTVAGRKSNTPVLVVANAWYWRTPGTLDSNTTPSTAPRAAVGQDDNIQVVWVEPFGPDLDICGKYWSGVVWKAIVPITGNDVDDSIPELVPKSGGDYHLAWYQGGASQVIFYQFGKDDAWSSPELVSNGVITSRPAIGELADGKVVVAWSENGAMAFNTRVPSGSFDVLKAGPVLTPGTNAESVAGAVDTASFFHLAYVNGASLVHATTYDGITWADGGTIAAAGPGTIVALAADRRGKLHALWWDTAYQYAFWDGSGWSVAPAPAPAASALVDSIGLAVDNGDALQAVVQDDSGAFIELYHFSKLFAGAWSAGEIVSGAMGADSRQPTLIVMSDLKRQVIFAEADRIWLNSFR